MLSYDPKYIDYDKYLISASNRNGVAGNRFQLAGLTDPGERVPYTLSLAGGGDPVALPSADGLSLTLGKSGTTCLTPTPKAWAGADVKEGISAMCLRSPLSPALGAALVAALCRALMPVAGKTAPCRCRWRSAMACWCAQPPVAKQTTGWTHRREGREMVLENTGNVRVVLLDARVGTSAEPRSLALFPGVPQRIADGGLRWNDGGASRSLSCL